MTRVDKWAEKYPKDVKLCHCDDDYFSNAELVLIEHKSQAQYMGTTVVYIPQCTGEQPIQFFLYPDDRRQLIKTLQAIDAVAERVTKKEETIKARISSLQESTFRHPLKSVKRGEKK
jgi:hypothetical protein